MLDDFVHAFRSLTRRPRETVLPILLLAGALGLATAMFSLLDGVLLRGLPFAEGDRIVAWSTTRGAYHPTPAADYRALAERLESFEEVAAFRSFNTMATAETGATEGLIGSYVTPNLFALLDADPILGRGFLPEDGDPASPAVVVLAHSLWQRRFGGDREIVGRSLLVNREPMTIAGVMPAGFGFPVRQELWIALRWDGRPWSRGPVFGVGRLGPGTSARQAGEELFHRTLDLESEIPGPTPRQPFLAPFVDALIDPTVKRSLHSMLFAALGVLVVASANVGNLRLSSVAARSQELAMRSALGASRRRMLRQLLSESLLLTTVATILGLGLAWLLTLAASKAMLTGSLLNRQFWIDVRLDTRVAVFAVAIAGIAVTVGGLLPAWSGSAERASGWSRLLSTRQSGLRHFLAATEIAIAFVLVLAAAWLSTNAFSLLREKPSFATRGLMSGIVSTYQAQHDDPEKRVGFITTLLDRLDARPGIEAASYATNVPWKFTPRSPLAVAGASETADEALLPTVRHLDVWPGFFSTLSLPLLRGRGFDLSDLEAAEEVAVVSQRFADHYFDGDAIGQTIDLRGNTHRRARIIGVVTDLGLDRPHTPDRDQIVYFPMRPAAGSGGFAILRGRTHGAEVSEVLREEVAATDRLAGTLDHQTYRQARAEAIWASQRLGQLFSLFGLITLVVAAGGLFSRVSLWTRQRLSELGIRIATGARPRHLVALALRETTRQVIAGLLLGLFMAYVAAGLLGSLLTEVDPWSPTLLIATVLLVFGTALGASLVPARAASRMDPAASLRSE